jgi:hypothetical protein
MPRPRVHLRTLMIAVAVAGLECWVLVNFPSVGVVLAGPLIGSPLMGLLLPRDRVIGFLGGGVAGGMVETVLIVIFVEAFTDLKASGLAPGWGDYGFWFLFNALAGFLVGLTFVSLYVARIEIASRVPQPRCHSTGSRSDL